MIETVNDGIMKFALRTIQSLVGVGLDIVIVTRRG